MTVHFLLTRRRNSAKSMMSPPTPPSSLRMRATRPTTGSAPTRRPAMAAGEFGLGSMYATTAAPCRRRRRHPWDAGQGRPRRGSGRKGEVRASCPWATGSAPMPAVDGAHSLGCHCACGGRGAARALSRRVDSNSKAVSNWISLRTKAGR